MAASRGDADDKERSDMGKRVRGGVKSHRDAGTGKFVTKKYADSHKKTTVSETRRKKSQ
ncbi:MAG: hypothetical protein ACXW1S_01390 [Acidimicrobiia bacterium]